MTAAIIIGGWLIMAAYAVALVKVGNRRTQFDRVNRHTATQDATERMFPSRFNG